MGSGGGPSTTTTTSEQRLPPYVQKIANQYITQLKNQVMPGGHLAPSPLPYQQVAPLTEQQLQSMQDVSQQAGEAQPYLNEAMAQQGATAAGAYLDPSTNPELAAYYNAAALPMVQNYQQATAPNIVADAVRGGNIGGSGEQASFANAQSSLAQGLGTLGANIYEPAYQQERQLQQSAAQGMPSMAAGQFVPAQQLAESGQTGQQQAQNILNTAYQNLYSQAMWPYTELQQLGQGIPLASGGGGNSVQLSTSPSQGSMK